MNDFEAGVGGDSRNAGAGADNRRSNISLGVERFGLMPLRAPRLSLAILAILITAAVFGVQRIQDLTIP